MVLKAAPPLVVEEREIDAFANGLRDVVELMHSSSAFWTEALGLARRVMDV
jgi:ornithine--oxo-acid transaminase